MLSSVSVNHKSVTKEYSYVIKLRMSLVLTLTRYKCVKLKCGGPKMEDQGVQNPQNLWRRICPSFNRRKNMTLSRENGNAQY